jgi:3-oxoacyl-[acyl-carrier-protein] synthase I
MSAAQVLQIAGAGAATSVGLSLAASAAAIRAAVDNFQETHFYDRFGEPLLGAAIPLPLPGDTDGSRTGGSTRFAAALSMAIEECLANAAVKLPLPASVPLLLLGDDTRAKPLVETAHGVHRHCAHFFAQPERLHMQAFTSGESSCIAALAAAREFIAGGAPAVLIAGVDSWLNVPDIHRGLSTDRLLSTSQAAGFIPGEAAAAVLVCADTPGTRGPVLLLRGIGMAEEPATLGSDLPCTGRGLANALRQALAEAGLAAHEVSARLCDAAGEEYFFEEAAYAWARVLREPLPPGYQFLQPATRTGHVGAAFGPLLIGYVWQLMRVNRLHGPHALVHLSSLQPLRGALVLSQRGHA